MLDFDPDGLGGLNTITNYLVGTAIVALGIAIAVGATMLLAGRNGGLSRPQERGLKMIVTGTLGVTVLASLGTGIAWSMTHGQEALMPERAQQQDIVVEREAPTTTCTEQAVRNFDEEPEPLSSADRRAVVEDVAGDSLNSSAGDGGYILSDSSEVDVLKWYPVGPDCSGDNYTAAEGTDIEIEWSMRSGQTGPRPNQTDYTTEVSAPENQ